jgi:hypothetical protein
MSHKLKMVSAAVALALGAAASNAADFDDMVSVRGFGTFGVMHSTEDQADVLGSVFQPDGAGYTRDWDMRSDTKLAGQVDVRFTDKLSFTVQALSQYQHDRTFAPQIEWANLKYAFNSDLSVRVGRIALPTFMISDSRMIGYANTFVRPPEEVYQVSSITSNDGVDVSYSFKTGGVKNTMQAFYGISEADLPAGNVEADSVYGLNYLAEAGSASFRVGYIRMQLDLNVPSTDPLIEGLQGFGALLNSFGLTNSGGQALALASKYDLQNAKLSFLSIGGSYDPGSWFVMSEAIDFGGDTFLSDMRAGYITAGARLGKVTPYAVVSKVKAFIDYEDGISTAGMPVPLAMGAMGLSAGVNQSLNQFRGSQQSAAVGVRWDGFTNIALKGQYNYVDIGDNSNGMLGNVQPGFEQGGNYSLFSLSVDFIF